MTNVESWLFSLSAEQRRKALYALHCYRTLGENMPAAAAVAHARDVWQFLEGLLPALEADHEDMKQEESRPTIPSPRISGEYSVVPGPPDAKSKK